MPDPQLYSTIARLYDVLDLPFEYRRHCPLRKLLWQGVNGRVPDAGIGNGRNIAYCPTGAEMVGTDLSGATGLQIGDGRFVSGDIIRLPVLKPV